MVLISNFKNGKSHWRINGNGDLAAFNFNFYVGPNASVDAGTSLLEFTNTLPVYVTYADVKFHNVLFSNAAGTSTLRSLYEAFNTNIPLR
ncbi:MAG: hypothetical protein IPO07_26410 [Haliscomenobacter sp.]|nr:hypothetical protein [Haliscomenobacter sp.]MBK9491936.1 hypothetical protein [Haliscomenobacter sp.]